MLTDAQVNHILTLLDSDIAHDLFETISHDNLAPAIYARNTQDESASADLKAELGGKWTDTFRKYEQAIGKTWVEFELAAFLRGLIAGAQLGPLFDVEASDQQPATSRQEESDARLTRINESWNRLPERFKNKLGRMASAPEKGQRR